MTEIRKVLFLYPNFESLRIPLAVSILIAKLKSIGIETRVFDTTFSKLEEERGDYRKMESQKIVKKTRLDKLIGEYRTANIEEEIQTCLSDFKPDLIAVSVLERTYKFTDNLIRACKTAMPQVPILAGGILATIYPDILLEHPCIDYICMGEGEDFIVDFVTKFHDKGALHKIPNLMFMSGGDKIATPLGPLTDMSTLPFQDWESFDTRHLLKPYEGNVWIGGSFELSRGCKKRCTFCVAPALRSVYGENGKTGYHRTKPPDLAIAEIKEKKEKFNLTLLAMCDTDFLAGVPKETLFEFCRLYKKEIDVPWMIQTSAESFSEDKLSALIDSGCISASIGVESGSVRVRKETIQKFTSLDRIKKTFDLCRDYNFRTTANFMIGLPYETEDDIWESIKFCREINPPSIAVFYFTPFLGTSLYDLCLKEGFYSEFNPDSHLHKSSPLNMPQLLPGKIEDLLKTFAEDFETYKKEIKNVPVGKIELNNILVNRLYDE